ncbi:chromosome partitioning protein ParB, partial [Escherichia coli]|nr:chromosome partitioning protein ParB [Escherichia coli]
TMILSVFITVISGHDKPQPPGCLLDASLLEGTNIVVLECITLADLLTNDNIDFLYKS